MCVLDLAQTTVLLRAAQRVPGESVVFALECEACVLQRPTGRNVPHQDFPCDHLLNVRLGEQPTRKSGYELVAVAAPSMLCRQSVTNLDRSGRIKTTNRAAIADHHSIKRDEPNE